MKPAQISPFITDMPCNILLQLGSKCIMNLSASILYPVFGKASHICESFEGDILTLSWKYVCLDNVFIMSVAARLNLLYNPPDPAIFKSVCVGTSWIHAFQLSIADGHNRSVIADIVSEEGISARAVILENILWLDLHKAMRSAFASNLMSAPCLPSPCVFIWNAPCLLTCCFSCILYFIFQNLIRVHCKNNRSTKLVSISGLGLLSALRFCLGFRCFG